jgi:hypothetical protein
VLKKMKDSDQSTGPYPARIGSHTDLLALLLRLVGRRSLANCRAMSSSFYEPMNFPHFGFFFPCLRLRMTTGSGHLIFTKTDFLLVRAIRVIGG